MTEIEALRQEVADLRRELAELRSQPREVHHHYGAPAQPYRPPTLQPVFPHPYYPGGPWPVTCETVSGRAASMVGILMNGQPH